MGDLGHAWRMEIWDVQTWKTQTFEKQWSGWVEAWEGAVAGVVIGVGGREDGDGVGKCAKAKWTDQKLIVRKAKAKGDTDPRKVSS